jgi:hypothetical protein
MIKWLVKQVMDAVQEYNSPKPKSAQELKNELIKTLVFFKKSPEGWFSPTELEILQKLWSRHEIDVRAGLSLPESCGLTWLKERSEYLEGLKVQ